MTQQSGEFATLGEEVREIWNTNAEVWDGRMGDEGNRHHKELIAPAQERLLALEKDELVLDVACGNGQFARRMAGLGARVVATDHSERLIELAEARTTESVDRIEYRVVDATNTEQLMALGSDRFDAAICGMALMDMSTIEPLLSALGKLLRPGGRFVFSVTHPCFNSAKHKLVLEEWDRGGKFVQEYSIKVSGYITPTAEKGLALANQPAAQFYFDRPLSLLFNACFGAGFVLDGIEEPVFDRELYAGEEYDSGTPSAWWNKGELPPTLVARLGSLV